MRLLVYGSGFKYRYSNELDEIKCGKPKEVGGDPGCVWSPSIKDFEVVAQRSGGGKPAAKVSELLDLIEKQQAGSIDELRVLGHANQNYFALAGDIVRDDVIFNARDAIIGEVPEFRSLEERCRRARDRFSAHGVLTLAGCDSGGVSTTVLRAASRAFGCCVKGFQKPVYYGFLTSFPLSAKVVGKDSKGRELRQIGPGWTISERGRLDYSQAFSDYEAVFGSEDISVAAMKTSAWDLKPDAQDCSGQLILNAAGRVNRQPIDGSLSAFEVGWRILREYYPDEVNRVAGVGHDPALQGLRVEREGTKVTIVVGKPYVEKTNPATLNQRVKEMGQAVDLVREGKTGVIPMS